MDQKKRKLAELNEDDLMILKENLDESKRLHYVSYTDRYFKKYYQLNIKYDRNDHLVLLHSNKIAVIQIAPSHPILEKDKYKIEKIEFIQDVTDEMSGKHKHNAKNVHTNQPICKVYCKKLVNKETDEYKPCYFLIYSSLNAKLLETNERLLTYPELLQEKASTEGFIAILMPKLDNINEQTSALITHDEYVKQRPTTTN